MQDPVILVSPAYAVTHAAAAPPAHVPSTAPELYATLPTLPALARSNASSITSTRLSLHAPHAPELRAALAALRPGGSLTFDLIVQPADSSSATPVVSAEVWALLVGMGVAEEGRPLATAASVRRALLFSGFSGPKVVAERPLAEADVRAALAGAAEPAMARVWTAVASCGLSVARLGGLAPAHSAGAGHSLGSHAAVAAAPVPRATVGTQDAAAAAAWGAAAANSGALIDENSLVSDKALRGPVKVASDCTTKRAPCKGCVCGRADEATMTLADLDAVPQSSCGNCSLGDAFRCAGCPSLGTPAFDAGEAVVLPASFLADDF